jgi:flavodoxin
MRKRIIAFLPFLMIFTFAYSQPDYKERKNEPMKVLVVYYSLTGNTELVAKTIAEMLRADIRRVEEVKQRKKGIGLFISGGYAAFRNKCSEIKPIDYNLSGYDLIFLGSPIWAGKCVPAINTFIKNADFKDKKVVCFFTMESKNYQGAVKNMTDKIVAKSGTVIGSFAIRAGKSSIEERISKTKEAVSKYIK